MPFDSNGAYALPNGYRAVTGQTVLASQHNGPLEDVASALSTAFLRNGAAPMQANIPMGGYKITGLGEATNDTDAVSLSQLQALQATVSALIPTGIVLGFRRTTPPPGWIKENGGTIGNAASGATTRANADTLDLFTLLWAQFSNAELPIQTNAGAASTRGSSAQSDFDAGKRMTLFDSRSRFHRGADDGLAYDTSLTVGVTQDDAFKSHTHTGTTASSGAHTHTIPDGGTGGGSGAQNGPPTGGSFNTGSAGAHTHTFTTEATGVTLETRPRSSVLLYCIKL